MKIQNKNYITALIPGIIIITLDLLTKKWALAFTKPKIIWDQLFYFTYQKNAGIAFGIHLPMWFQILASIIILAFLFQIGKEYIFTKNRQQFLKPILFGIIIGGALGNLVNRILQGYVVDFIVLKPFPVFNIADIGITVGLIALFIVSLIQPD